MSKMLYFEYTFTGLTMIPAFFELSELSMGHLDSPAELFLIQEAGVPGINFA